jgi:hypothetical protein
MWLRELFEAFLFQQVDAVTVARFRVLVSLFLAYALWPRGVSLSSELNGWPVLAQLYRDVFLSTPYRVVVYGTILWFAVGWCPRIGGVVLFCLMLPNEFLSKGRVSGQLLLTVVLLTSLLRTAPIWRWDEVRRRSAGPMWPIRLMQCQLTLLYGINAIRKSTLQYLSGEVLMALSASRANFLVDLTSGYMSFGSMLVPVSALAVATVAIEYWLAVGWWVPRARLPTAALGVSFHLFLKALVIRIFLLDATTMLLYLSFLLPFAAGARSARLASAHRGADPLDDVCLPEA